MGVSAWCRFEGHGADGAFIEDFTMRALNVRFQGRYIRKDKTAMNTSVDTHTHTHTPTTNTHISTHTHTQRETVQVSVDSILPGSCSSIFIPPAHCSALKM